MFTPKKKKKGQKRPNKMPNIRKGTRHTTGTQAHRLLFHVQFKKTKSPRTYLTVFVTDEGSNMLQLRGSRPNKSASDLSPSVVGKGSRSQGANQRR